MREVVQIIKCDIDKDVVHEEDVNELAFSFEGVDYLIDLCPRHYDDYESLTVRELIKDAREARPLPKKKKSGHKTIDELYPHEVDGDGKFVCLTIVGGKPCGNPSPTMRGLKMHYARTHK